MVHHTRIFVHVSLVQYSHSRNRMFVHVSSVQHSHSHDTPSIVQSLCRQATACTPLCLQRFDALDRWVDRLHSVSIVSAE